MPIRGRGHWHQPPPQPPGDPMTEPTDLLTITEAAHIVRAPVATLRYWRHLGTGPRSFRLGRRVVYRRTDLETWINEQRGRSGMSGNPATRSSQGRPMGNARMRMVDSPRTTIAPAREVGLERGQVRHR